MIVDILKWNPIHSGDFPADIHPSIYMKPDIKVLDLFNRSPNHQVLVKISGTGHEAYDNAVTFGIIDKSSDLYNKRDNLFDCNGGLYVITLGGIVWQGYPFENGKLELLEKTVDEAILFLRSSDRNVVKKKQGKVDKNEEKKDGTTEEGKIDQKYLPVYEEEKDKSKKETLESFESPSASVATPSPPFRKKGFSNRILIFIGVCIVALLAIAFLLYGKKYKKRM